MIYELLTRAASSSNYEIDGQLDPTLNFVRGQTYVFQRNDSGHALYIKNILGAGESGRYDNGIINNGTADPNLDLTFSVPLDAPDTLFYQCGAHYSMNGQIKITSASAEFSITSEPIANSIPAFVTRVLPSDQNKTLIHTDFGKFIFCKTPKDWTTAAASTGLTTDLGIINLSSIGSAIEATVINQALSSLTNAEAGSSVASDGGGAAYVWLGGTDTTAEGVWNWSDTSSWAYENWGTGSAWDATDRTGEPDNYNEQDYLAVSLESWPKGSAKGQGSGDSGQWNDLSADNLLPSLLRLPVTTKRLLVDGGQNIAFDANGSAGQTAKTIVAVLGTKATSNTALIAAGLSLFDSGKSLEEVCGLALSSVGVSSNEAVVELLYMNLYGAKPTKEQSSPFVSALDNGTYTPSSLTAAAAELTDDLNLIDLTAIATTGLVYG